MKSHPQNKLAKQVLPMPSCFTPLLGFKCPRVFFRFQKSLVLGSPEPWSDSLRVQSKNASRFL